MRLENDYHHHESAYTSILMLQLMLLLNHRQRGNSLPFIPLIVHVSPSRYHREGGSSPKEPWRCSSSPQILQLLRLPRFLTFHSALEFQTMVQTRHSNSKISDCPHCGKAFARLEHLQRHVRTRMSIGRKERLQMG